MQQQLARSSVPAPVGSVPLSFTNGQRIEPTFRTVTSAFYHHASTQPDVPAARDLSAPLAREMTYGELAGRASRLSRRLTSLGVKPGDRVPLVVKRGVDMLVGIIAVLSCGAQYVPLDGGVVPDSTLRFVLGQAGGGRVLCLKSTKHRFEKLGCECEVLVIDEENDGDEGAENGEILPYQDLAEADHGCYVIYTSAAWEMLGCLCNGGTLVLRGSKWEPCLRETEVLICTPSILAKYDPREYSNIKVAATAGEPSSRRTMMYNTGDLGRWRQDGSIDILGRVDDQIKIKGFRVELDGVTASLNSCPVVSRATALLIGTEIHGFVAPKDCDIDTIQVHIRARQPYYAIPTKFHFLDALPLTANGKVDKRALTAMAAEEVAEKKPVADVTVIETGSKESLATCSQQSTPIDEKSQSSASSFTEVDEKLDLDREIPGKALARPYRGIVHRIAIVYRRLFTIVGLFNIAAVIALLFTGFKRDCLSTLTAINLIVAVLARQDFVINALYAITCNVPKSWPLAIRKRCAKIYHFGGVHSGAAISAGAWLLASNISDEVCLLTECPGWGYRSTASKVVSWILTGLFTVTVALAYPTFRKQHHDLFERAHRFVGWTMLGLFWVQVVLAADDSRAPSISLGEACTRTPGFWLLAVATLSIASSWLFLRKVPVEAEVLSNHAVRLHFGYTIPVNGSFVRLSHRPLLEWHSFATIPAPEAVSGRPKGFSLVVSNAGDWTRNCIDRAPTSMYVRGVPVCGVMRIATCFNRIVVIATGSGIGPLLGHIQAPSCPTQLIWSTPRPEQTFGKELLDTIKEKIPNAVIHDTKVSGRPDLVKMGYNLTKSFGAEAVIIIANEKITKKVVYGLETRGVPAYGAIWDS
ncbi:AMP-binding enzyme [Colletotrichum plurivorum]|uniref:AMP-binding enzyme n=1 Tax=Colletotrichum plurivorum TaxID=2175906 RepID=A0A8H6KPZ6_9PEZI|nr:AMP-binding enzyme [Colletotrichum plurivorum]